MIHYICWALRANMSSCKNCDKSFASRQSLSNHHKRMHPDKTAALMLAGQRFADSTKAEEKKITGKAYSAGQQFADSMKAEKAEEKKITTKAINAILGREPSKADTSLSVGKETKMSTDSDTEDSEDSDGGSINIKVPKDKEKQDSGSGSENIEVPKDKESQDSLLTDYFIKLYSNLDEDDVELCTDILQLLDELKRRGCVTEHEYMDIKSRLKRQIDLNLYETIDSTVENMVQDDKKEVLGLLRSMKKKR